jgi:IclR family KDG regulon transcriptional repressor
MAQKKTITLSKSLDLLELFGKVGTPLTIKEICQHSSLPESTVYRYIKTLSQRDYVEYDPAAQKYRLGTHLIKLGYIAMKQIEIHRSCYPIMENLARETGETVTLSVRKGNRALVLEVVDSGRGGIKLAMNRGDSLPLHLCAITRPLVTFLPEEEIDSILHRDPPKLFTTDTLTDWVKIKSELQKVKHQGYSYSAQQLTNGAAGLGAPIWDFSEKVVGTLGLVGPLSSFEKSRIPTLLKSLLDAARECSMKMGFRSPKPSALRK